MEEPRSGAAFESRAPARRSTDWESNDDEAQSS